MSDSIMFLGTAGARFMVSKQYLNSGGTWLHLRGKQILVDPAPGTLVRAIEKKLDPAQLDAIVLSHKHLDHSVDINIMIEAMTESGWKRRGVVFAPADAVNNNEAVILPYLMDYPEKMEILAEGVSYAIGDVTLEIPMRHQHPVETYGLKFRLPEYTISWITDTGYTDSLIDRYKGDLLIINTVMLEHRASVKHLSLDEVEHIIGSIRPEVAIITHFGMGVWEVGTEGIARKLSDATGVSVIAAHDGMKFDLGQMGK